MVYAFGVSCWEYVVLGNKWYIKASDKTRDEAHNYESRG